MKVHLCFAGIVLLGVVAPATAAESEAERLKQAQGLFQPLPQDMATPEAPITLQRVDLGGCSFSIPD
jgi:cytochrome c peroxidase